jgi:diadenosine tetraphosphatase ApaH/serine/threonine PP2A family protein phosphatase
MRIAFLSDLHANPDALTACLEHAKRHGAERYVFLGDLVGYGAEPGAVVDTVRAMVERGAVAIAGNHDLAVTREPRRQMNPDAQRVVEWTRSQLDAGQLAFLAGLPPKVEEGDRLYVHANAWAPEDWEYITHSFDAGRSMRATSCRLTFCGHTHDPALYHMTSGARVAGFLPVPGAGIPLAQPRRWLAIPGSAGQPRDGNPAACYALFEESRSMLTFFRVPYDFEAAASKIRRAGLPEFFGARLIVGT